MPKFEKQFIYFMWDDKLKGKECFVADNIDELKSAFDDGDKFKRKIVDTLDDAFPFKIEEGGYYRFAYYDPNYSNKKAYEEGKQIQFEYGDDEWRDVTGEPTWNLGSNYRIKPKGYRAFKNADELKKKWEELCPTNIHRPSLYEPFIWVRCKANNSTSVIIRFAGTIVTVNFANYNLEELLRNFTFLDGTPCGIEE